MLNPSNRLLATAVAAMLMSAAEAEASTSGGTPSEAPAERKRAEASNFLPIVRGRLPLIFVHANRFDKVIGAMSTKDASAKFGTSVGKIFDIRKGRNFGYVTEAWKPTPDDVASAEGWIKQVGADNAKGLKAVGDVSLLTKVLDQYKERGLATAEEQAAQSALRTRNPSGDRRQNAEGGRRASDKAHAEAPAEKAAATSTAGTADDLLS